MGSWCCGNTWGSPLGTGGSGGRGAGQSNHRHLHWGVLSSGGGWNSQGHVLSHRYLPHWTSGILNVKSLGHRWRTGGEGWVDWLGGDQLCQGGGVKFCGCLDGVVWCGGHFFGGGARRQDGEDCGAGDGGEPAVDGTAVAVDYVDEAGSAVAGSVVVAASDDVGAGDVGVETPQSSTYVAGS